MQDEIAMKIANAMQINITEGEIAEARSGNFPDNDIQAYFKFLRVEEYYYQFTKDGMTRARKELEELLHSYPERSGLHALLGAIYVWEIIFGACESDLFCFGKATEAVRKALYLDANNSDAHSIAGWIYTFRKEFDKAIAEQKRAIMLNPNNGDAYAGLGWALTLADEPEDAILTHQKAIRLNPIPPVSYLLNLGWA